jgi:hypothetical protein
VIQEDQFKEEDEDVSSSEEDGMPEDKPEPKKEEAKRS